jgi:uncharacterized protein involved in exopolysaccharide biosynthesis
MGSTPIVEPSVDGLPVRTAGLGAEARLIVAFMLLVRRWRVLVASAFVAAVVVGGMQWRRPRTYTATATFVVQGGRTSPGLSGLASQFGFSLPGGGDGSPSAGVYVEMLRSRSVLGTVAHSEACDPCSGATIRRPVMAFLGVTDADTARATAMAVRQLQTIVVGDMNPRTGIVTLSATTNSAALAQQVAQRALDELISFNLRTRRTQASGERRFGEQRLDEVAGELRAAEQRLQEFRESNRVIDLSPALQRREGQLVRDVQRFEDVYTGLGRSVEQAKIDEMRDMPSLLVLDPPARPFSANPRRALLKAVFAAIVGGTLAALILLGLAIRRRAI